MSMHENLVDELVNLSPEELKKVLDALEKRLESNKQLKLAGEIIAYCRDKIAGYKRPKSIEFIKESEMPVTATGKILHRVLREKYGSWNTES